MEVLQYIVIGLALAAAAGVLARRLIRGIRGRGECGGCDTGGKACPLRDSCRRKGKPGNQHPQP